MRIQGLRDLRARRDGGLGRARTCYNLMYMNDNPTDRQQCITTLARELFGGRFVEKTETRKKGKKKMYNYKTDETAIKVATKLMKWTYTRDEIDPEFARRYEPRLQPSGTTAASLDRTI